MSEIVFINPTAIVSGHVIIEDNVFVGSPIQALKSYLRWMISLEDQLMDCITT
jgi:hypothetical protein